MALTYELCVRSYRLIYWELSDTDEDQWNDV